MLLFKAGGQLGPMGPPRARNAHNCLELLAATLAVKTFLKDLTEITVLLKLENQTAVAYINNMGGTVSPQLTHLAISKCQFK